ncbi:MAG: S49 family peptidase [Neisseriaceae bacterium]|nr:S49 family peptidase [Neisseriaceae bacterium]MBP6862930.1 S49 family peptidase [Neisseriaceae bacterium]
MDQNNSWERQTIEKLLLTVYKEQRRAKFWRLFWRIAALIVVAFIVFKAVNSRSVLDTQKSHTAVIDLVGSIDTYNDQATVLLEGLEAAYANKNVKGVVIRANSPGGSPVISSVAFDEITRLKALHKDVPLYVVAEDVCASGCYFIASAADKIYANPASLMGSIGVIAGGFGFDKAIDKLGIERRLKTAGDNKGMGDPFSPETPEQNAIWTSMLDDIHGQFIAAVKQGRKGKLKDDPELFSGRVYTGAQAKTVGLVDEFGSVYSVARDVIKAPDLVNYTPQPSFSRALSRTLGSEVKQSFDTLSQPSW